MKLGEFKKLHQIAPNQFEIETDKGRIFQSYNYVVCCIIDGKIYLNTKWDYSKTTTKYLCQFLNVINKNLIKIYIKHGLYIVKDFDLK